MNRIFSCATGDGDTMEVYRSQPYPGNINLYIVDSEDGETTCVQLNPAQVAALVEYLLRGDEAMPAPSLSPGGWVDRA